MLERFTHFIACILLVLMPLQVFAAASMSICNSMMQVQSITSNSTTSNSTKMPCHEHMASLESEASSQDSANSTMPSDVTPSDKKPCKTVCATLCANLSAMTALLSNIKSVVFIASTDLISLPKPVYTSITQPNLQRPPNFFS